MFQLPVTKHWIHQFVLGLVLIGHCPLRGVVEIWAWFKSGGFWVTLNPRYGL